MDDGATTEARTTPAVTVTCRDCGADFELATRNVSRHKRDGTAPRCRTCRLPGTQPSREQIAEAREWWLSHFSLEELRSWPQL